MARTQGFPLWAAPMINSATKQSILRHAGLLRFARNDGQCAEDLVMTFTYPTSSLTAHPARLSPAYRSTIKRSPSKPLIPMRHTLTELTGPVYGHETVRENDNDLTIQATGEPLGERIIVHGHVLDEDGRGVPDALVELWQANAFGRYIHVVVQQPWPLDPNSTV